MILKNIYFRVDSSSAIGSGHVMRCLALADYFKKKKINSYFIKRNLDGNYIKKIEKHGHNVYILKRKKTKKKSQKKSKLFFYKNLLETSEREDAEECLKFFDKIKPDIIIIDHYGISKIWHDFIKKKKFKIMVIDDLADRKYNCDILLDTTEGRKKLEYKKFLNKECKLLIGAKNSLIRDEFIKLRKKSIKKNLKNKFIKNVLISMGGSDPKNTTEFIIKSLDKSKLNIVVNVVLGKNYKYFHKLYKLIKKTNIRVNIMKDVNNMAKLAYENDLAITTPSVTALEFCTMGLPCMVITNSENQKSIAYNLHRIGALVNLGFFNLLNHQSFINQFTEMFHNYSKRLRIVKTAHRVCNGSGKSLVYKNILKLF